MPAGMREAEEEEVEVENRDAEADGTDAVRVYTDAVRKRLAEAKSGLRVERWQLLKRTGPPVVGRWILGSGEAAASDRAGTAFG